MERHMKNGTKTPSLARCKWTPTLLNVVYGSKTYVLHRPNEMCFLKTRFKTLTF